MAELVEIGIHHEQQHQELLLTDILSLFASQPLLPIYAEGPARADADDAPLTFTAYDGGIHEIGHAGDGFSFDNEGPRHRALLQPFALADRLVTNGEWLAFMRDGGYRTAALWLADGWSTVKTQGWQAPLYWEDRGDGLLQMSLHGLRPVDLAAPVDHVSFYEADAYARWAGHRLPTEFEWEHAAIIDADPTERPPRLAPEAAQPGDRQMFGDVWQWTQSAYLPYPGYKAAPGAIGEYNGKFMCSQQRAAGLVLRDAAGPCPGDVPQLLLSPSALAVHRPAPCEGPVAFMTHTSFDEDTSGFAADALEGLGARQKTLPCQYLYDARGSELFEAITGVPEYYPTRTEIGILEASVIDIVADTPSGSVLVEFGSGSSRKTEILLAALDKLAAYVPIDVSASALEDARERLSLRFPRLRVEPMVGDFRDPLRLPDDLASRPRLGFFPGSTIGNFRPGEAKALLCVMADALGPGGRLIIGVDLRKATAKLLPAYDDAAGVTAAFNKNLLARANRELGADFDLDGFRHEARFNGAESRIEMHLVSERAQTVRLLGRSFAFRPGESIHTENSHKYTVDAFQALAREACWAPCRVWTDAAGLFSVHEIVVAA